MALKASKKKANTNGTFVKYWEEVDPTEFEYADGLFEVRVFDSRELDDLIHVQFVRNRDDGRRKVATLDAPNPSVLKELVADLESLAD